MSAVPAIAAASYAVRTPRKPRRFTVSRNASGRWVAREERGLVEGVFFSERDAVRFAIAESGDRPFVLVVSAR